MNKYKKNANLSDKNQISQDFKSNQDNMTVTKVTVTPF